MRSLKGLLQIQNHWSTLPRRDELLIERIKTRDGYQVFIFPWEGRLVHEGLSALLAHRLSSGRKATFTMACNDHGLVLQSPTEIPIENGIAAGLFSEDRLAQDISQSMNATEMAKRQFRQIARVAGLIQPGFPGQRKSAKHLQASSNLFFGVFEQYDSDNLLLKQSRREVLEQQLELSRMKRSLQRIASCRILITDPPKVTPFAFPLLVDKLRERVSNETLADRIARLQSQLEKAAG
jgi:ATP-dependent Lhr-like helicase